MALLALRGKHAAPNLPRAANMPCRTYLARRAPVPLEKRSFCTATKGSPPVSEMVRLMLPDGSVREVAAGTTAGDVARTIGPGLAKAALAARLDGEEV